MCIIYLYIYTRIRPVPTQGQSLLESEQQSYTAAEWISSAFFDIQVEFAYARSAVLRIPEVKWQSSTVDPMTKFRHSCDLNCKVGKVGKASQVVRVVKASRVGKVSHVVKVVKVSKAAMQPGRLGRTTWQPGRLGSQAARMT